MKIKLLISFLGILFVPILVVAHPGGLDSNEGHYCRTDCEEWELKTNEYHYHDEEGGVLYTWDNNEDLYSRTLAERLKGRILLQVEENGEAWYVRESDDMRYYMKDGAVAYEMMRYFSLGISNENLAQVPTVADTTEMKESDSVCSSNALANRLKGQILLQVEENGEAYYVDPEKCRAIYMKDGDVAYEMMRFLGLGITNDNLEQLPIGSMD